jgi:hypothetical protein
VAGFSTEALELIGRVQEGLGKCLAGELAEHRCEGEDLANGRSLDASQSEHAESQAEAV